MQPMGTSGSRATWPLAAICCLGLILFVICAAVVLALIPVYLPTRSVTPAVDDLRSTAPFYASFDTDVDEDSAISGEGMNNDEILKTFTSSSDVRVAGVSADTSVAARRKRGMFGERKRRETITVTIIIAFEFVIAQCNSKCMLERKAFQEDLKKPNGRPCNVAIDGGPTGSFTKSVSLKFKDLVRGKPKGFRGKPTSDVFTCVKSGSFNDPDVWEGGRLPSGKCKVVIPAGLVITVPRASMRLNVSLITVFGKLILGGDSPSFSFRCPVAIRVMKGGSVEDATLTAVLILPMGSLVHTFTGASFCKAGTKVQTTSPSGAVKSITISKGSGPSTIACLPSEDTPSSIDSIFFFAIKSGGFKSGSTFIGGIAPSIADCEDAPCGIYILAGVVLSTADLNGVLDINIGTFIIAKGATMEMGTPGSLDGFKFKYSVKLLVSGILSFVASGGGILLPPGSDFVLFDGASFISVVETFIQVYDPITGGLIGVRIQLGKSMSGPFSVIISITGAVSYGNTVPGSVSIPTVMPTVPSVTVPVVIPTPAMDG